MATGGSGLSRESSRQKSLLGNCLPYPAMLGLLVAPRVWCSRTGSDKLWENITSDYAIVPARLFRFFGSLRIDFAAQCNDAILIAFAFYVDNKSIWDWGNACGQRVPCERMKLDLQPNSN